MSLYTGWLWICILVSMSLYTSEHQSIYGMNMSLHMGWTCFFIRAEYVCIQDEHESISMMNMCLYIWPTWVYGVNMSLYTGWTWVYIRGEHKHINWVNKSLYIQSEHESIYLYTGWTWVYIQSERGWSLFPCKVSVFKSWVSNLFKAEIYTLYCGLVCGPHVGKKAICYT